MGKHEQSKLELPSIFEVNQDKEDVWQGANATVWIMAARSLPMWLSLCKRRGIYGGAILYDCWVQHVQDYFHYILVGEWLIPRQQLCLGKEIDFFLYDFLRLCNCNCKMKSKEDTMERFLFGSWEKFHWGTPWRLIPLWDRLIFTGCGAVR